MTRTRAADDFPTIRARLEELRRERGRAEAAETGLVSDLPVHRGNKIGPVVIAIRRLRNAAG